MSEVFLFLFLPTSPAVSTGQGTPFNVHPSICPLETLGRYLLCVTNCNIFRSITQ